MLEYILLLSTKYINKLLQYHHWNRIPWLGTQSLLSKLYSTSLLLHTFTRWAFLFGHDNKSQTAKSLTFQIEISYSIILFSKKLLILAIIYFFAFFDIANKRQTQIKLFKDFLHFHKICSTRKKTNRKQQRYGSSSNVFTIANLLHVLWLPKIYFITYYWSAIYTLLQTTYK